MGGLLRRRGRRGRAPSTVTPSYLDPEEGMGTAHFFFFFSLPSKSGGGTVQADGAKLLPPLSAHPTPEPHSSVRVRRRTELRYAPRGRKNARCIAAKNQFPRVSFFIFLLLGRLVAPASSPFSNLLAFCLSPLFFRNILRFRLLPFLGLSSCPGIRKERNEKENEEQDREGI